jgi:hypothetical protein
MEIHPVAKGDDMSRSVLRRALTTAAAALAMVFVSAAPAPTAHAATSGWIEYYYMFQNSYTNQCMEVNSTAVGAPVHQWPCWGGDNQRWLWKRIYGHNDYSFRVRNPGFCLTNSNGQVIKPCVSGAAYQWYYEVNVGGGLFELRGITYNNCIQVQDSSTLNGAALVFAPCNGSAIQRWRRVF